MPDPPPAAPQEEALGAAPLPLPWRDGDPQLDISSHFAHLEYGKNGTDGIRIHAYAGNAWGSVVQFVGFIDIIGPLSSGVAAAHRSVYGKSLEEVRRKCEAAAGLLVWALGLARPSEDQANE